MALLCTLSIQTTVTASDHTDRDTVIVTSSRMDSGTAIAGHVTVIDAAQIKASPAQNIPELLKQEAGIAVRSLYGNGTRTSVDLRGFGETGTQNTLVLLNGRRLNDVDLSAINYATIPLDSIERIEILRGSGAVLYGDGAVSGTINIVTKQPQAGQQQGRIKASAGSFDRQEINASWSAQSSKLGLSASVNQLNSDGYRDNNNADQTSGRLDLRLPLNQAEIFLKLEAYDQALELPGVRTVDPGISLNELSTDRRGTSTPNDWADEDGQSVTLGFSHLSDTGIESVVDFGYRNKYQEAQYDYGFGFGDFNQTEIRTFSLTPRMTVNHVLFGRFARSRIGVDIYDHEYDSDRSNFKQNIQQPIHVLDIHQQSTAAYVQTLLDVSDLTQVDFGGRIQSVRIEAKDTADATAPGAFFPTEADDFERTDTEHMLELGVQHQLLSSLSIYTRLGRSARFSNVDELFEFNDLFVQVFSPLKPQTSRLFEVGMNYQHGPVDITASIYRMDLQNEIHFLPASFQNINLDDTRRTGFEFNLARQFGALASMQVNYSYTRSEFVEGPFDHQRIPLVPAHQVNLNYIQQLSDETSIVATWRYVGSSYFANDLSNTFGQKIPDYQVVDIKISKQLDAFLLSATVNNLFDEEYYSFGVNSTFTPGRYNAYPLPERHWLLTLEYAFGD